MSNKVLLQAENVAVKIEEQAILTDINMQVREKEIVTIIGPNGAGKSTLIKVLLGLQQPNQGHINRYPQLKLGYMPQRVVISHLFPMTVQRFLCLSPDVSVLDCEQAVEKLKITHLMNKPIQKISGGEMQRVLFARAFLSKPNCFVLDEPAQGLDISGQAELYQLIVQVRDETQCAVIMVSHDLHWVMAGTDQVICLNKHVCCHGHPTEIQKDPAYLKLFGGSGVVPYVHEHNHEHGLGGQVIDE